VTTRLLLARHGETVWNADAVYRGRSEVPLSETGRLQAQLLGRKLAEEGVTALHTSPLMRARETAEAIERHVGVAALVDPDLTDLDCGEWEGLSDREVKERYPDLRRTWLSTPQVVRLPGGESLDEVSARVGRVLAEVLSTPGVVVLVSHRVVHKVAICTLLGLDNSHFWDIRLDVAGVSEFECTARRRMLVRHNDTSHLAAGHELKPADF
jgi:broad specificity phosphatase PhoE